MSSTPTQILAFPLRPDVRTWCKEINTCNPTPSRVYHGQLHLTTLPGRPEQSQFVNTLGRFASAGLVVAMNAFYPQHVFTLRIRPMIGLVIALAIPKFASSQPVPAPARDLYGDILPAGVHARLGTVRLQHSDTIIGAAYSRNGTELASYSRDGQICFWEVATGRLRRNVSIGKQHSGHGIVLSADGALAAVGVAGGVVVVEPGNEAATRAVEVEASRDICPLGFTRDSSRLIAQSADGLLYEIDLRMSKVIRRIQTQRTNRCAYCEANGTAAYVTEGGVIALHVLETDEEPRLLASLSALNVWGTVGLELSPDGSILGILSWNVTLIDTKTSETLHTLERPDRDLMQSRLILSPNALIAAVGSPRGTRVWNTQAERHLDLPGSVLSFSPNGRLMASVLDKWLTIYDTNSGRSLFPRHLGPIESIAISPDGRQVGSVGRDSTIRLWDTATCLPLWERFRPQSTPTMIRFSTSGDRVFCAEVGYISTYRVSDGKVESRWFLGPWAIPMALSPGGDVAAHRIAETIACFRIGSGKVLHHLPLNSIDHAQEVAFSPVGDHLVAAGMGAVTLWNWRNGLEIWRVPLDRPDVLSTGFSIDGGFAFAIVRNTDSREISLILIEVAAGQIAATHSLPGNTLYAAFPTTMGRLTVVLSNYHIYDLEVLNGALIPHRIPKIPVTSRIGADRALYSVAQVDSMLLLKPSGSNHPGVASVNEELRELWTRLAGDSDDALRAMAMLVSTPVATVEFFRATVQPISFDAAAAAELVRALDSEAVATRVEARNRLLAHGPKVGDTLRQTLDEGGSFNLTDTARLLLREVSTPLVKDAQELRRLRALTVLACIGTPGAMEVLKCVAGGAAGARETVYAAHLVSEFSK